jgi:hypothetical protein
MPSYQNVLPCGKATLYDRPGKEHPYKGHVREPCRYELPRPEPNRRPASVSAEDTVAISFNPRPKVNGALSAEGPRMSDNLATDAEDASKNSQRIQKPSTVGTSLSNGQNRKRISRSVDSPLNKEDLKKVQRLSSPESSPLCLGYPVRIQNSSPVNSSAGKIAVPESDAPIPIWGSTPTWEMTALDISSLSIQESETSLEPPLESRMTGIDVLPNVIDESVGSELPIPIPGCPRNGHMTGVESTPLYLKDTERISLSTPIPELSSDSRFGVVDRPIEGTNGSDHPTIIRDSSQDIQHPAVDVSPINHENPENNNLPIPIWDIFVNNQMTVPLNWAENNGSPEPIPDILQQTTKSVFDVPDLPEPISNLQDHPDSSSDGRRHPDSDKGHENPHNKDEHRRARREAKLHSLHSRCLKTRALVSEKRRQLQHARSAVNAADEVFMKLIRERYVQKDQNDTALEASFKRLQATRDEYGPVEDAYNALEERLDREEYEVAEPGDQLLKEELPIQECYGSILDPQLDEATRGDSESLELIREQQHPLYGEYLSRLGDADLHRERYSDLLIEYELLLDEQQRRQKVGGDLQTEEIATIASFSTKRASILKELIEIEADVERLRLECTQEGLLGGEEVGLLGDTKIETDESDVLRTLNGSRKQDPEEFKDEKRSSGDKGDRIRRWLLHKLQSPSGLECELVEDSDVLVPIMKIKNSGKTCLRSGLSILGIITPGLTRLSRLSTRPSRLPTSFRPYHFHTATRRPSSLLTHCLGSWNLGSC